MILVNILLILAPLTIAFFQEPTWYDDIKEAQGVLTVRSAETLEDDYWNYRILYWLWISYHYDLKRLGYITVVENEMKNILERIFDDLDFTYLPKEDLKYLTTNYTIYMLEQDVFLKLALPTDKKYIVIPENNPGWLINMFFTSFDFTTKVNIKTDLKQNAQFALKWFCGKHYPTKKYCTFIGVYYEDCSANIPIEFYLTSMEYYSAKYKNNIFVLIVKDEKHISEELNKISFDYVIEVNPFDDDVAENFALLSFCQHTIIGCEKLSATTSFLNNGTAIVYDRQDKFLFVLQQLLSHKWFRYENGTVLEAKNDLSSFIFERKNDTEFYGQKVTQSL